MSRTAFAVRGGLVTLLVAVPVLPGAAPPALAQSQPLIGGVAGAAGGAVLGRLIAGKHNNTTAILGGAALGGLAGGAYGYSREQNQKQQRQPAPAGGYERQSQLQKEAIAQQVEQKQLLDGWRAQRTGAPAGPINMSTQVMSAQRMLKALRIYDGPVDGLLGQQTRSAVVRYQADAGLPQTGDVTPALIDQLRASM